MRVAYLLAATLAVNAQFTVAATARQPPHQLPVHGKVTSQGCFASAGGLTSTTAQFASSGKCAQVCRAASPEATVMALHGDQCFCGSMYPARTSMVRDEECDTPCPGYLFEACGSTGRRKRYSVYNLGVEIAPDHEEEGDRLDDSDEDSEWKDPVSDGKSDWKDAIWGVQKKLKSFFLGKDDDSKGNDGGDDQHSGAEKNKRGNGFDETGKRDETTGTDSEPSSTITLDIPTVISSLTQTTTTATGEPGAGGAGVDRGSILGNTFLGVLLAALF